MNVSTDRKITKAEEEEEIKVPSKTSKPQIGNRPRSGNLSTTPPQNQPPQWKKVQEVKGNIQSFGKDSQSSSDIRELFSYQIKPNDNNKPPIENSLDETLMALIKMGKDLIVAYNEPEGQRGIEALERDYETFKRQREIFLTHRNAPTIQDKQKFFETCKKKCLEEVEKRLKKKLFLNGDESPTSPFNQKIIQTLVPESKVIYENIAYYEQANKKIEAEIDQATKPRSNSEDFTSDLSFIGKGGSFLRLLTSKRSSKNMSLPKNEGSVSEKDPQKSKDLKECLRGIQKLALDKTNNQFLCLSYELQILNLYEKALLEICKQIREIDSSSMPLGFKKGNVIEQIIYLVNKNADPVDSIKIEDKTKVCQIFVTEILKLIEVDYKEKLKNIFGNNKKLLLKNVQDRTHPVQSITDLNKKLHEKLFVNALPNLSDIERVLADPRVFIYLNGKETIFKDATNFNRFEFILNHFSRFFFNNNEVFTFIVNELISLKNDTKIESKKIVKIGEIIDQDFASFILYYRTLMALSEDEKNLIQTNFEKKFKGISFETALKYLIFCHNLLGQEIIFYITHELAAAMLVKFENRLVLVQPRLPTNEVRSRIDIKFEKGSCEIFYLRKDGIENSDNNTNDKTSDIILTQVYSFTMDPTGRITFPKKFDIQISYTNELNNDMRAKFFRLGLLMESWNLPTELKYIKATPKGSGKEPGKESGKEEV